MRNCSSFSVFFLRAPGTLQNEDFSPSNQYIILSLFNKLPLSTISDSDFEHVQKVIKTFGITNFKEYHDFVGHNMKMYSVEQSKIALS